MGGVAFLTQDGTPSRYCNITSPPDTLPPPAICLEIKNMTKQKTNKVLEGLAKPTWQHPMPTNNQEKWWKKRFFVQPDKIEDLALDSSELLQAEDDGDYLVTVRKDEADAFLRQEIRQAKIETFEIVKMIIYESVQKNLTKNWVDGEVNRRLSNLKKQ